MNLKYFWTSTVIPETVGITVIVFAVAVIAALAVAVIAAVVTVPWRLKSLSH